MKVKKKRIKNHGHATGATSHLEKRLAVHRKAVCSRLLHQLECTGIVASQESIERNVLEGLDLSERSSLVLNNPNQLRLYFEKNTTCFKTQTKTFNTISCRLVRMFFTKYVYCKFIVRRFVCTYTWSLVLMDTLGKVSPWILERCNRVNISKNRKNVDKNVH